MFERLINKLKSKKYQLQKTNISNDTPEEQKPSFDILLSQQDKFFKMEISDYISLVDFTERMKEIDTFGIESMISNSVIWNSGKQRVNKGTYYIIVVDNRLYNILISEDGLIIVERTRIDQITEERIIRLENNEYWCTFFKHDATGNTFYTRYYNTCGFSLGALNLTTEETIETFKPVIDNLKSISGIENIIDLNVFDPDGKAAIKKLQIPTPPNSSEK